MLARIPTLSLAVLFAGAAPIPAAGQKANSAPFSPRPTHAALAEKQKSDPVISDGIERAEPRTEELPSEQVNTTKDFISRSTVLAHAGYWTVVPKGAVIFFPKLYRDRVDAEPKGRLLPWSEFSYKNRGWIYAQSVKFSDAAGQTALSQETRDLHRALGRVVVAVYRNGPISFRSAPPASGREISKSSP